MSIFSRGDVYWTRLMIRGVVYQKSLETSNFRRAEREERRYRDELELRQHAPMLAPELTFAQLAARFLSDADPKPYHTERLKILLPWFSQLALGDITRNTAREYRKFRHSQKTVSDTTINRDLEVVRHILFWAVDEGLLLSNPFSRVPMAKERRKIRRVLSVEDEAKLKAASSSHLRLIMEFALLTGMRRGELLAQRWEDIDFSRRLLAVSRSKTAEGESRELPLAAPLFGPLKARRKDTGLLFTFNDKPIHRLKTGWQAAIRRAGIAYLRFHDLRHTFNTRLMLAGVQQEIRKSLMGHSLGEDINSVYTHVEWPAKCEAIKKLERWLKAQVKLAAANRRKNQIEAAEQDRPPSVCPAAD